MNQRRTRAHTIAVTGGRSGIGRTHIATNLAIALQQQGRDTLLIDLDLGTSQWRNVFGVPPPASLAVTLGGRATIEDVMVAGPGDIRMLRGGAELERLPGVPREQTDRLLDSLAWLDDNFDFIVLDPGIGPGRGVMNFVQSADEVVAIATPESEALNGAYAALKMVGQRTPDTDYSLCVNLAATEQEGQATAAKLMCIARSFLHAGLTYVGSLRSDEAVVKAEKRGRPALVTYPTSPFSRDLVRMAEHWLGFRAPGDRPPLYQRLAAKLSSHLSVA